MRERTRGPARMLAACALVQSCVLAAASSGLAQTDQATRLLLLQADGRRAPAAADVSAFRAGLRSADADTARIALRALGRLHRVALIPELLPRLRHSWPEVRAEAANAVAEAAQGFRAAVTSAATTVASTETALAGRLDVETEPSVRAALGEALARLPYKNAADVERAEHAILSIGVRETVADRLGAAEALEALARRHGALRPLSARAIALLTDLAHSSTPRGAADAGRDARIRRLALQALTTANAVDEEMLGRAAADADSQVRRLAMLAASTTGAAPPTLVRGLTDRAPMVRLEALRQLAAQRHERMCDLSLQSAGDPDMTVALAAIEQLDRCGASPAAVAYLSLAVGDRSGFDAPREWHRNARALVALARAAPDQTVGAIGDYARARTWQLRRAAARAADASGDRATLEQLAADPDDRVANVALSAMGRSPRPAQVSTPPSLEPLSAADVRRLASPVARVSVRGVGRFDLALFTTEAPATVLRFVRLARSGFYNGLSFDGVMPNVATRLRMTSDLDDAGTLTSGETGMWPHVRGAVSADPDPTDTSFFIDTVDNPHFDHQHTVFGQILNGVDVVDRVLEGDIIDSIEIVP